MISAIPFAISHLFKLPSLVIGAFYSSYDFIREKYIVSLAQLLSTCLTVFLCSRYSSIYYIGFYSCKNAIFDWATFYLYGKIRSSDVNCHV